MKVLGYSGGLEGYVARFGTSHDAAAAIVMDGELVAAAEEERFDRRKRSGAFPLRAMEYCVREAGLRGIEEIDLVCYDHSQSRMWLPAMAGANAARMAPLGRALLGATVGTMRALHRLSGARDARSLRTFASRTGWRPRRGAYRVLWHHLAHAASAFYESAFERALCVAIDAQGESHSATAFVGDGRQLRVIDEVFAPNSLGYLYQTITRYLGFEEGDEHEVMGLAPYGEPQRYRAFFDRMVRGGRNGRFELDVTTLSLLIARDATMAPGRAYPPHVIAALGPPRAEGAPIEQRHMDVAAALQDALERAVIGWLAALRDETGLRRLCLAGGVALNCTMNGKIARSGMFDAIHVAPASHDAGTAAGAALYGHHAILGGRSRPASERRARVQLGPQYRPIDVRHAVREARNAVRATRAGDVPRAVARAIAAGKVVGFFQGRMEWGPHALGNRSILADPRREDMKDLVDHAVKLREGFRPFAPAVLAEEADAWFDTCGLGGGESPFMLFTVPVRPERRGRIPAVTHVDGSARVQTVRADESPRFHAVIRAFHELTGVPVLLNTSFNVRGEPIVMSPTDAIRCFLSTRIDLLVLDDLLVEKRAAASERRASPSRGRDRADATAESA